MQVEIKELGVKVCKFALRCARACVAVTTVGQRSVTRRDGRVEK